ncbi:MAG: hypothetical protein H7Z16_16290 [Pyrinomonadaceae bacterium]|nr:hypothetical protein [Pyrinomonadaceae bacterium]
MKTRLLSARFVTSRARLYSKPVVLALLMLVGVPSVSLTHAQQQMSKRYPAPKNVRIVLKNIFGTITVESWNRDEIKLTAILELPRANVAPRHTGSGLTIDVMADNPGRSDVGDVNFKLQVPVNSSVDLETKRGQITVTNIRGDLVRAHVSLEGDIDLINISAGQVYAQNTTGNIYFDGEFARKGIYQFQSGKGHISIRIPAESAFHLTAAAPTKQIALGQFWNDRFKNLGNGRKYEGEVVDGRSKVMVTNFNGSITFLRR